MNIIKLRTAWYVLSGILIGGSILALAVFHLKFGIDFTGGSSLTVRFEHQPTVVAVEHALEPLHLGELTVQPLGETDINIRTKSLEEDAHQAVLKTLGDAFGAVSERQYTSFGPSIGKELEQKSVTALLIVFIAILVYIAWSFRKVSAPIQSWKYGIITIITAFHDVIVPAGVFALLGKFAGREVGTPFIAAILTIMGYSINDTIVVLDRVRENLQKTSGSFEEIVGRSVRQTLLRSFNTSVATLLTLIAIYLFGGESIRDFSLALIVGIATGTYSSIFIAAPLLITWNNWSHRRRT